MKELLLLPAKATRRDHDVIAGLIDAAAKWLRTKDTDQWSRPWRSMEDRSRRITGALHAGKTWIVWNGRTPVATITADPADSRAWPEKATREAAVYVSRLVVNRDYAGHGLGAQLLDWAGLRAKRMHQARWVRVDVWTTNEALQDYYRKQGFTFLGYCESIKDYPSAALYQKPTAQISPPEAWLFRETSAGA